MKPSQHSTPFTLLSLLLLLFFILGAQPSASVGQHETASVEVFPIENPTAAHQMQRSFSTFEAGSPSYLDDPSFQSLRSSALSKGYRNDQPLTKTITFTSKKHSEARVMMATDKKFKHLVLDVTLPLTNHQGSYQLSNFVPNTTYYYKVKDKKGTLTSGAIKATGQLRMIKIDSSWNIRDLGGWKGWEGHHVRYEWIYRGGSPGGQNAERKDYHITPEDQTELHRIGIRAHLDLRGMPGQGAWPRDEKLNAHSLGYSPLKETEFMNISTDFALYNPTTNSAVVGDMAWIIQQLRKGHPVYFHCRTGADRTGTLGYLILGLLGCDAYPTPAGGNQIATDYELTSLGMDEQGTIEYNTTGRHSGYYSNRYANTVDNPSRMSYGYFRSIRHLESSLCPLQTFQERCYYYLNRYFQDHDVASAGKVFINKKDLDWFVNFMLGITDRDGHLMPGQTTFFAGPDWAIDEGENSLSAAFETAKSLQYSR